MVSKLDPDTLEIKDTWNAGWKKAWSGNAFMLCGTLYVLKKYNDKQVNVNFKVNLLIPCTYSVE